MDDRGVLSLVKKVVHSLVVSSPEKMTIEKLMRDYRSEEGCSLPYRELGFKDADSFLRSIPDTVKLMGHGPMALITPVATAKSAHIQKLVHDQKKSRSRGSHKPKNMPPRTYQRLSNLNLPVSYPNYNRLIYPVYANINEIICAGLQQSTFRPQRPSFSYKDKSEPLRVNNWSQNGLKPEPLKDHIHQSQDDSKSGSTENKQVEPAQELEEENQALAQAFENQSVDVAPIGYQEKPEYEVYEADEEELVRNLFTSDEVKDPEKEDEAMVPVSKSTIQKIAVKPLERQKYVFDYVSSDDGEDESAIPSNAVDDRVLGVDYPTDSVRSDFTLPVRDIESVIELQQRIEVQLVSLVNPHNFSFWIYNEEFNDYKALYANMQMFYESHDTDKYTMPMSLINTDHLCVVRSSCTRAWERAKVVGYQPSNRGMTIEVELVDKGDIICVSHQHVKFLLKQFASLPPQCLAGRLAFITQWKAPNWPAEAVNCFYKMVSFRRLYAKVEAIKNNIAYLVLVDPETHAHAVNLNRSLIDSGWVRRCISA
ncbi:tudor domain-containing protein 5 isoform X2 [Drosophila erecta]|uniref:tudor domain-containing protein 5 isoform X2 n=1 Tax=Drosophila erecta TaxID=7220 RepID=UPI000F06EF81|nr:tudor domain-containing protein 5 isoform X2 [Drosophila erecta]